MKINTKQRRRDGCGCVLLAIGYLLVESKSQANELFIDHGVIVHLFTSLSDCRWKNDNFRQIFINSVSYVEVFESAGLEDEIFDSTTYCFLWLIWLPLKSFFDYRSLSKCGDIGSMMLTHELLMPGNLLI